MAALTADQAFQLGLEHQLAGRLAEAEGIFRQIIAQQPQHADAWHRLGAIALSTGHMQQALELISQAVARLPGRGDFQADLGVANWVLGRREEAVACFLRALAAKPDMAHVYSNLGDALHAMGHTAAAIPWYERSLEFDPKAAGPNNNFGIALLALSRLDEAAASFRRATVFDPNLLEAQSNLGATVARLGQFDEGLELCQRVLARRPDFAGGHLNLGVVYWRKGDLVQAQASFRRAIECDPQNAEAHLNLGLMLLLLGHYREGWREYEWRFHSWGMTSPRWQFPFPRWDGTPAPGRTLLVHNDQGFGDTIHFLRYLPLVRARSGAARVAFVCLRPLVRLVTQTGGWEAEVVATASTEQCDLHVPLMSLPLVLDLPEPLPMTQPYLQADAALRESWRARLGAGDGLRVGLAWAGNATHLGDRCRSIPFERLRPLLDVAGVSFYSLQIEPRAGAGVIDLTEHFTDFAETAALMAELDLIISVDTATAHLAGALGRPVWTLLPFVPDWRWGLERADTPWYPTMRLFRQPTTDDWASVIVRVAAELTTFQR